MSLFYRKQNVHKKPNNVLRGRGCCTSWIIPTQKTVNFPNAVSNEERTSRFYRMSYVGEDLKIWRNQLLNPLLFPSSQHSRFLNCCFIHILCFIPRLSSVETVDVLLLVLKPRHYPFRTVTFSLMPSGWADVKKKMREREGKEMNLACFILVERLWRVWNVTLCCFSLVCPSSGSSVHLSLFCRPV